MSNQPPKKSDENKKWMSPRRDRGIVIAPEYHLIISEGTKTEPNYFNALKDEINKKYPGRISIDIEGMGKGTTKLLDRAQRIVRSSPVEYKHVWLVYDKDEFTDEDFDSTASACKSLSNSTVTVHALWSNQCIEYWFLLHYNLLESDISRDEYYPKLSRYLKCEYHKNSKDIYDKLKPKLKDAIRNAKKMAKQHENLKPSKSAPGTTVYELFEMLINYIS